MNFTKEQIDFVKHCGEHFEVLTGGRGHSKIKQIIEQLQQENARLKDKIEKIIEYVNHYETIRGYYEYEECGYDEYNYEEDLKEELLEILKEN